MEADTTSMDERDIDRLLDRASGLRIGLGVLQRARSPRGRSDMNTAMI